MEHSWVSYRVQEIRNERAAHENSTLWKTYGVRYLGTEGIIHTRIIRLMAVLLALVERLCLVFGLLRVWSHSLVTGLVDLSVADAGLS